MAEQFEDPIIIGDKNFERMELADALWEAVKYKLKV